VTSTRRFTSLFISPTFPVSRYVCCVAFPLLADPASEPVLPAPPAAELPVAAPELPVVEGVPVALPVREPPVEDPDIDEPLIETLVRMNSDPAPAPAGRDADPLAVDPVDPLAPLAPPAPPGVRQPVTVTVSFPLARFPALVPCCPDG
jgi:hypothetical protein